MVFVEYYGEGSPVMRGGGTTVPFNHGKQKSTLLT